MVDSSLHRARQRSFDGSIRSGVGVEGNLLPGVQFQKLCVQLGLYAFVRIASESKAEGRFVRLDRLDDGLRGADRIAPA